MENDGLLALWPRPVTLCYALLIAYSLSIMENLSWNELNCIAIADMVNQQESDRTWLVAFFSS